MSTLAKVTLGFTASARRFRCCPAFPVSRRALQDNLGHVHFDGRDFLPGGTPAVPDADRKGLAVVRASTPAAYEAAFDT